MKISRSMLLGACALASMLPGQAMAATFIMKFSGASLGNTSRAEGSFDITDAELARINATPGYNASYSAISNLTLTVTGAAAGNGVFTTANFGSTFQFFTPFALDLSRELVGQALPNGTTFGQLNQNGGSGDFNLFGNVASAPVGFNYFTLEANGAGGVAANQMALVSLVSGAVPEPATWAMMMLGFGAMGAALRRKQKVSARIRFA